jgi:hypothetical protein
MSPHHGETTPPPNPVTQADLNGLAENLDSLDLPGSQKIVLSAIITAAAKSAAAEPKSAIPSFHDQFAAAFTPAKATRLVAMNPSSVLDIDPDQPPGT